MLHIVSRRSEAAVIAAKRQRSSSVDRRGRNRPPAAPRACVGGISLFEARPPRSKSGELKPAYSQSTSQSRLPSSMMFAASRSLWPKTRSIGPTARSSSSACASRRRSCAQVGARRLATACARSRGRRGTPRRARRARADASGSRGACGGRGRRCGEDCSGSRTSSGVKVWPSMKSSTSTPGSAWTTSRRDAGGMRGAARGELVLARRCRAPRCRRRCGRRTSGRRPRRRN